MHESTLFHSNSDCQFFRPFELFLQVSNVLADAIWLLILLENVLDFLVPLLDTEPGGS